MPLGDTGLKHGWRTYEPAEFYPGVTYVSLRIYVLSWDEHLEPGHRLQLWVYLSFSVGAWSICSFAGRPQTGTLLYRTQYWAQPHHPTICERQRVEQEKAVLGREGEPHAMGMPWTEPRGPMP